MKIKLSEAGSGCSLFIVMCLLVHWLGGWLLTFFLRCAAVFWFYVCHCLCCTVLLVLSSAVIVVDDHDGGARGDIVTVAVATAAPVVADTVAQRERLC